MSEFALDMNERLANTTADYESATIVYSTFESDGYGAFHDFPALNFAYSLCKS